MANVRDAYNYYAGISKNYPSYTRPQIKSMMMNGSNLVIYFTDASNTLEDPVTFLYNVLTFIGNMESISGDSSHLIA